MTYVPARILLSVTSTRAPASCRTGGVDNEGDQVRTEIIADYGWPSIDLVGDKGADAA